MSRFQRQATDRTPSPVNRLAATGEHPGKPSTSTLTPPTTCTHPPPATAHLEGTAERAPRRGSVLSPPLLRGLTKPALYQGEHMLQDKGA